MPQPPRDANPELTAGDLARYARQIVLPELGLTGQQRLAAARVLVVGAGGLGSPALLYLAAAGVGTIGVVDFDTVEESNLHRQVIHPTAAVGTSKVASAAAALAALNPGVAVVTHDLRLDESTIDAVIAGYDVVLDGSDNFPTRYLVNDACVRAGLPLVWASVLGFAAQVAVFWTRPPDGVELRDLFPAPPAPGTVPSCAEAGVIGAVCGQVGSIMAAEAIKLVTGIGRPLLGRVLVIDVLAGSWDELPLRPSPDRWNRAPAGAEAAGCAAPAPSPATRTAAPTEPRGGGRESALTGQAGLPGQTEPAGEAGLTGERREAGFLLDVREPDEFAGFHLPGSTNLPLARVLSGEVAGLPAAGPIVVVCRSGRRAELAAAALTARGFREVQVMAGGLLARGLG